MRPRFRAPDRPPAPGAIRQGAAPAACPHHSGGVSNRMATRRELLQLIQNPNYASVLAALWRRPGLTRNDLSRETGLAIPTISRIVGEMISAGLVSADGEVESKAGRPAGIVAIAPGNVYAAGIDLGGSKIAGILVDLAGERKATASVPTGYPTREGLIASMAAVFGRLLESAGIAPDRVVGVGLGVPGTVDPRTRVLIDATNLNIVDWNVEQDLAEHIGLPVIAENDANAAALGELYFGAPGAGADLVFVSVGTGIGAGLLLDGKVYRGPRGLAGEIGHIIVDPGGPPCSCGRRGCVEAYAGGWAVARAYAEAARRGGGAPGGKSPVTAEDVFHLAEAGDKVAAAILSKASEVLGLALANLINTLGVDRIVLGGGMIHGHESFFEAVRSTVLRHIIGEYQGLVDVQSTSLGPWAGVYGACALVLQAAFQPGPAALRESRPRHLAER